MIRKQPEEIVMRKHFRVLFLSVVLIGGIIGTASAMQYSVDTSTVVATPEPSSLILLGLGLISMIGIVRWKKWRKWNMRK